MLPLPGARAGDHARAARRGVRQLFPRRDRVPGGRSMNQSSVAIGRMPAGSAALARRSPVHGGAGGRVARSSRPRSSRAWRSSRMFTVLAVRLGLDFACDRAHHRPAAARQRGAGRRADRLPAADRHRRSQPARAGADDRVAARADAGAARRPRRRWLPELATALLSAAGLLGRDRRQAVARPQLRPDAGEPRRRVDRALPAGAASDLHGLPDHARRLPAREPDALELLDLRRRRHRADDPRGLRGARRSRATPAYRDYQDSVRWRVVPGVF